MIEQTGNDHLGDDQITAITSKTLYTCTRRGHGDSYAMYTSSIIVVARRSNACVLLTCLFII